MRAMVASESYMEGMEVSNREILSKLCFHCTSKSTPGVAEFGG